MMDVAVSDSEASVLVLDVEGYYARDVVRCLAAGWSGRFHVLGPPWCLARFCAYATFHPLADGTVSDERLMSAVDEVRRRHGARVLLPADERAVAFVARHLQALSAAWRRGPVPAADVVEIATDKVKLSAHLARHGLPQPETELVDSAEAALAAASRLGYPLLLKPPRSAGGGAGIRRADSAQELRLAFAQGVPRGGVLVQSYLRGEDVDCSVLCLEGRILAYTVQKPAAAPARPYAPARALRFVQDTGALAVVTRLMASLHFNGVAHVDMRRTARGREPCILEISARFWQTLIASLAAGVNFPRLTVQLACGESLAIVAYRPITFAPCRLLFMSWLRGQPLGLARPWRLRTGIRFVASDPASLLWELRTKVAKPRLGAIKQ